MRLSEIRPVDMTDAQRQAYDAVVAGPRGRMPAPMQAWIRAPGLAHRAEQLGAYALFGTSLPPRLREVAILVTARHWSAQYEWYAHKKMALEAGVRPALIDAIARGETPSFTDDAEEIVYTFSRTILVRTTADDALYARAVAAFGETAVVELVGVVGYYCLVSLTLNVFEIGVPEGEMPELAPLGREAQGR